MALEIVSMRECSVHFGQLLQVWTSRHLFWDFSVLAGWDGCECCNTSVGLCKEVAVTVAFVGCPSKAFLRGRFETDGEEVRREDCRLRLTGLWADPRISP